MLKVTRQGLKENCRHMAYLFNEALKSEHILVYKCKPRNGWLICMISFVCFVLLFEITAFIFVHLLGTLLKYCIQRGYIFFSDHAFSRNWTHYLQYLIIKKGQSKWSVFTCTVLRRLITRTSHNKCLILFLYQLKLFTCSKTKHQTVFAWEIFDDNKLRKNV